MSTQGVASAKARTHKKEHMKKVIDGKTYNTETADELASYENGYTCCDFNYSCTALYKTKSGAFFLAGHGGPLSGYSQRSGSGGWTDGNKLIVITESQAKEWVEAYSNEDYEKIFGDAPEA